MDLHNMLYQNNLNAFNVHKKAPAPAKPLSPLSAEIKNSLEEVLDGIVDIEKEEYHNDLVPFSQHEKQIREKGEQVIEEITTALEKAQKLLKEHFELEEKENPTLDPESHFARWEEASQKIKGMPTLLETIAKEEAEEVPLQQRCSLPWPFMDRVYATTKKLQEDKRLEDAASVFKFLTYVNSLVFEYWIGEANALFDLARFEEALEVYTRSLPLQPENPYVFYQIGTCCFRLGDIEGSDSAFDFCIDAAKKDESKKDYVEKAMAAKRFLESKKIA